MSSTIVLKPGELYVGSEFSEIKTLLGSCVAAVIWHPRRHITGMCHIVHWGAGAANNFSYAGNAIKKLYHDTKTYHTHPSEFHVEVFGGGNMFPNIYKNKKNTVGSKNANMVIKLLTDYGFKVTHTDVGGTRARKISLFRESGKVITVFIRESEYES